MALVVVEKLLNAALRIDAMIIPIDAHSSKFSRLKYETLGFVWDMPVFTDYYL